MSLNEDDINARVINLITVIREDTVRSEVY